MHFSNDRLSQPHFDWQLFLGAYALAIFGVLAVTITNYDPSLGADRSLIELVMDSYNGRWQAAFVLVSFIAVGGMMSINYQFLGRVWPFLYIANVALLTMVLASEAISGMSGWFTIIWDRTIQPSELAKVAVILSLSKELSRHEKPVPTFRYFVRLCVHIGIPLILIIAQPDIGTMLVFIVIFFCLLLMSGFPIKYWLALVGVGLVVCVIAGFYLQSTNNWRWLRLTAFINPEGDPNGSGFQTLQAMSAVGAGGLTGVGMFQEGTLTQLNYVPENHTDFIFSSIAETMGFVGCMLLLALYAFVIFRMLRLSYHTSERFGRLIIVGVASMLIFHMFENVGMNIGVMPITGIPLPFISYGGSNLIANMAGIGLVLNVTSRKPGTRATGAA